MFGQRVGGEPVLPAAQPDGGETRLGGSLDVVDGMVAHLNSVGGAGVGSVATGVSMAESGANDRMIDGPQAVAEAVEVGIDRAESISEGVVEV